MTDRNMTTMGDDDATRERLTPQLRQAGTRTEASTRLLCCVVFDAREKEYKYACRDVSMRDGKGIRSSSKLILRAGNDNTCDGIRCMYTNRHHVSASMIPMPPNAPTSPLIILFSFSHALP